ncbi:MAG: GNAT family N-acetyltransferase [Dechloromonas sp.]|nr:GNAT family N-acetyltransferase [Dechloromonas sp.]
MNTISGIRDVCSDDEAVWRRLWEGYNTFYGTTVTPEITSRTWQRMLDAGSSMLARLVEVEGRAAGFSISVLHEGTWVSGAVCYLEDLFVDPAHRGRGLGRMLIQDLIACGRAQNWSTVYWMTRRDNPARRLYDEFVKADDFVRYRLHL